MEIEDRRTFQRLKIELPLSYSRGGRRMVVDQRTYDISADGMGFVSASDLGPGSEISMSLALPGTKEEFNARGRVVWSKRTGKIFRVGIALEEAGFMAISALIRVLRNKAS